MYVPESSQVHRCNGKIFDRNNDADIDITNNTMLVAEMFGRKQNIYTENRIFPYVTLDDLRIDLINLARKMAHNQRGDVHPWDTMTDMELLRSANLYSKDLIMGKEGMTLAGVLIFGKDEIILSALPHHKTDVILRIENLERYDDRDDIRTNLIKSYDRLMAFISKHLSDKFYLVNEQRVSIRNKIFREVCTNTLMHREYGSVFPAKLIIERNYVKTENANRPHGYGEINADSFSPFPKNPVIAKFFKEIGLADELGSGIKYINKYLQIYSDSQPRFIEGDIFELILPVTTQVTMQVNMQVTMQDLKKIQLLKFCEEPKTRVEMQSFLELKNRENFRKNYLIPLIESGELVLTIPDKPNSKNQKYYRPIINR